MKNLIVAVLAITLLASCAPVNKHLWGYEKAIPVKDASPSPMLYYSITGVEDKVYWDMFSVHERAKYLAFVVGYEGKNIACSGDGKYLYIGVE